MDVVGLLLDVGPSMGHEDEDGFSCLSKAKDILSLLVQRKIFSQSDDKLCLFTYGSEGTANELATNDDYQHVSMERDLKSADWQLCKHVQTEIEATNHRVDFLDALIVISTYMMNEINSINDKKVKKKMEDGRRILMVFSNLDNPVRSDSEELEGIIQGFKENQLELHFVGFSGSQDDGHSDDNQPGTSSGASNRPSNDGNSKPKTANQLKAESIVQQIVGELDGCAYDFRQAMAAVSTFESKKPNSMAWNPDLVIGSTLRIPISGFKWVTREAMPSFKKCSARNTAEGIERKYDTFLPDDTNTEVDKEDIIKGYRYGTDLVPFTDDDMANMKYKCDAREFSVVGFTQSSHVKRHYFAGKDTMLIMGRKNSEEAAVALSALVQALQDTDSVAIVRKVYSARSSPTLGALLPAEHSQQQFLRFIELPFTEDMRELEFPPLSTESTSNQQLQAMDSLIDAMDMSAVPVGQPFSTTNIPNPTLQRLYQVLAAKAADESCQIPEASAAVRAVVNNTAYSSRWTDREQENFSQLYKLERNEKLAKGGGDNLYKDSNVADNAVTSDVKDSGDSGNVTNLRELNQDIPTEVGSIAPVRDFQLMLKQPKLVLKAYTSMQERVLQLVRDSVGHQMYDKALQCLKAMRAEAVTEDDQEILKMVNDFLLSMKSLLTSKGPGEFWKLVTEERISLIDSSEASNSAVEPTESASYLTVSTGDKTEQAPAAVDDDEDMMDMI